MTLQQEIIKELGVKPTIDVKQEIRLTIDFMKEYLQKHSFLKSMVLGISGGQDSTLLGKLAQMAVTELNKETEGGYEFIAVSLPYGIQFDEHDRQDALDFIGASREITINIKEAVDASDKALLEAGIDLSDFAKGNEKARERMKAQYSVAAMYKGVVLGTDHAAEAVTGFYTKFGDGGADLVPLFRLNKRQGRAMLKELGAPEHLYMKIPTADLEEERPAIPDEVALGVTYDHIDDYLEGKQIDSEAQQKIEGYFLRSRHKRTTPVTVFDTWWKQ